MTLYLKNKIISFGGGSSVTDEDGKEIYNIKGKVFSLRKKKSILTPSGDLVYRVQNKLFNFFAHTAYIFDKDGNRIASVSTRPFNFKKDFIVRGLDESIIISGSFLSLSMDVCKGNEVLGTISREINFIKDAFKVSADEENMNLVLAFALAIDNIIDNARSQRR